MTEDYTDKWISIKDKAVEYPAWVQYNTPIGFNVALRTCGVNEIEGVTHWQPAEIPKPVNNMSWLQRRMKQIPENDECGFWNGARETVQEACDKVMGINAIAGNPDVDQYAFVNTFRKEVLKELKKLIGE